jgi:hypothetical protein
VLCGLLATDVLRELAADAGMIDAIANAARQLPAEMRAQARPGAHASLLAAWGRASRLGAWGRCSCAAPLRRRAAPAELRRTAAAHKKAA